MIADVGVEIGTQRIRENQAVINVLGHIPIEVGAPRFPEPGTQGMRPFVIGNLLQGTGLDIGHVSKTDSPAKCSKQKSAEPPRSFMTALPDQEVSGAA